MKNKKTKIIVTILLTLSLIFTLVGCENSNSLTVTLVGSTSVGVIAQPLAQAFELKNFEYSVEVQGGGSTTGITQAIENSCDIGMSSRNLKDSEKNENLIEHKIAVDGIAIIIHPLNPISNLTTNQIKGLFTGDITNWNEIGGNNSPVVVVSREAGSGTRGAFEDILDIEDIVLETIVNDSTGGIRTTVASNENAIGYISAGSLINTVKSVNIENIECTSENIFIGTYVISRPLLLLTNGTPNINAQKFIDFILSDEGQKVVEEKGFIKVN